MVDTVSGLPGDSGFTLLRPLCPGQPSPAGQPQGKELYPHRLPGQVGRKDGSQGETQGFLAGESFPVCTPYLEDLPTVAPPLPSPPSPQCG